MSLLPILGAVADANLYAARYQMAISIGFHIILASFGVALLLISCSLPALRK